MARPKRREKSGVSEFKDPLKNYDGPEYADELERTIVESAIDRMRYQPVETIPSDATVEQTMRAMAEQDVGCAVIVDADGRLAGIFSERDVLNRVASRFEQIKDAPITTVMTRSPMAAYTSDSTGKAMNLMAIGGFRHVPILDVDDKVVGVLGPRRVSEFLQVHIKP